MPWPRRGYFEFFRSLADPRFSLTASADVTRLMEIAKPRGVFIFNAALSAIVGAANAAPDAGLCSRLTARSRHTILRDKA